MSIVMTQDEEALDKEGASRVAGELDEEDVLLSAVHWLCDPLAAR